MPGALYLVATPIGNLEDITLRALSTLKEVDAIACEDTRVTSKLLARHGIRKPLFAIHEHTRAGALSKTVDRLLHGENIAYVSDAGTPGVNDPGGKLVELCYERGIRVVPIPGASALTAAISVCGFPMDDFAYIGFLPQKKGRATTMKEIAERPTPTVFFESTHRIQKALDGLAEVLPPNRRLFIGRELTKMHETLYRGTIDEVTKALQSTSSKGEFVVIVGPAT